MFGIIDLGVVEGGKCTIHATRECRWFGRASDTEVDGQARET